MLTIHLRMRFQCFSVYYIVGRVVKKLAEFVSENDIFISLMAALSHDVGHKGLNNGYLAKKKKNLSIRYPGTGILENFHISNFFKITSDPAFDIFASMPANEITRFRQLFISTILFTDMTQHNSQLEQFKMRVKATKAIQNKKNDKDKDAYLNYLVFSKKKTQDIDFIVGVVVHAIDIGNPCWPYEYYINWAYLCIQEFNYQTVKEKQSNLEVSTMLQYKGIKAFYNGQAFFASKIFNNF
eukprot:TRINITY_DN7236_c0_g1_i1.p1 TRINITY_DN7236_c0_g1~~TRINITY_DN7236_c0_g1_i1.p1  ORF type:complete len:240 (-),score=33.16 TRINITY_DN7236_c0_g1_i1:351-1070(-)